VYYVHQRYLVALAIAVLATVAALVVPRITHAIHENEVNAAINATDREVTSDLSHLKVPKSFIPVTSGPLLADCLLSSRCYRVDRAPQAVASMIAGIFRTVGVNDAARHGSCSQTSGTCEFSVPVGSQAFIESIDVFIQQLDQCQSLTPRRGCKPANASEVTFS